MNFPALQQEHSDVNSAVSVPPSTAALNYFALPASGSRNVALGDNSAGGMLGASLAVFEKSEAKGTTQLDPATGAEGGGAPPAFKFKATKAPSGTTENARAKTTAAVSIDKSRQPASAKSAPPPACPLPAPPAEKQAENPFGAPDGSRFKVKAKRTTGGNPSMGPTPVVPMAPLDARELSVQLRMAKVEWGLATKSLESAKKELMARDIKIADLERLFLQSQQDLEALRQQVKVDERLADANAAASAEVGRLQISLADANAALVISRQDVEEKQQALQAAKAAYALVADENTVVVEERDSLQQIVAQMKEAQDQHAIRVEELEVALEAGRRQVVERVEYASLVLELQRTKDSLAAAMEEKAAAVGRENVLLQKIAQMSEQQGGIKAEADAREAAAAAAEEQLAAVKASLEDTNAALNLRLQDVEEKQRVQVAAERAAQAQHADKVKALEAALASVRCELKDSKLENASLKVQFKKEGAVLRERLDGYLQDAAAAAAVEAEETLKKLNATQEELVAVKANMELDRMSIEKKHVAGAAALASVRAGREEASAAKALVAVDLAAALPAKKQEELEGKAAVVTVEKEAVVAGDDSMGSDDFEIKSVKGSGGAAQTPLIPAGDRPRVHSRRSSAGSTSINSGVVSLRRSSSGGSSNGVGLAVVLQQQEEGEKEVDAEVMAMVSVTTAALGNEQAQAEQGVDVEEAAGAGAGAGIAASILEHQVVLQGLEGWGTTFLTSQPVAVQKKARRGWASRLKKSIFG